MDSSFDAGLHIVPPNDENVPNIPNDAIYRQMMPPRKISVGSFPTLNDNSLFMGSPSPSGMMMMQMQGSPMLQNSPSTRALGLSHGSFIAGSPSVGGNWPNSFVAFSPYFGNADQQYASQISPLKFDLNSSLDNNSFDGLGSLNSNYMNNDSTFINSSPLNNSMATFINTNNDANIPPMKSKATASLEAIVEALKKEAEAVKKEAENVKKDAENVDKMKAKLKADMETLEAQNLNMKSKMLLSETDKTSFELKISETEALCAQLKQDMQHLNDIYSEERSSNEHNKRENFNLQQELNKCKFEIGIYMKEFQNMHEIKNQSMAQISELKSVLDSERRNHQAEKKSLEKNIKKAEIASAEACKHFWNLTEEVNSLKREAESFKSIQLHTEMQSNLKLDGLRLISERALMANEDTTGILESRALTNKKLVHEIHLMKQEHKTLKDELKDKEEAYKVMFKQIKALQDGRTIEKAEVNSRINTMNESIKLLKSQNAQLEQDLSLSKSQLLNLLNENPKLVAKIDSLKLELQELELSKKNIEQEHALEVQEMTKTKDDLISKLTANNNQMESIQNQARTLQQKFYDDNQKIKETEKSLRDEINRLSRDLHAKNAALTTFDTEKSQQQDFYRTNIESMSNLISNLESELERRLEDLTSLGNERDRINEKCNLIKVELEEQLNLSKREEQTLRRALESEKSSFLFEIKQLQNKISSLDSDAQEKSRELSENRLTISSLHKDITNHRATMDDQNKMIAELKTNLDTVASTNQKMADEIRMYITTDEELRTSISKLEIARAEDAVKCEAVIKKMKKSAEIQINEANSRVRQLLEQLDELKAQKSELIGAERRTSQELEKLKIQFEVDKRKYEGANALMLNDISMLKKELADYKARSQKWSDSNSEIESGFANFKVDRTNLERENARLLENCRDFELKMNSLIEKESKLKRENEILLADLNSARLQISETTNKLTEKTKEMETLEKNMSNIERETQAELRRAKLQLKNAESDLFELKPLVPMLQKELTELKSGQSKQNKANNPDVEDLIKDLRELEAVLASEKKKYQSEVPSLKSQLEELQSTCESLRENLDDVQMKAKADGAEKDLIISKLQAQRDKVQSLIMSKDDRIEELERLQKSDRTKVRDCMDKISTLEKQLASASNELGSSSTLATKKTIDGSSRRRVPQETSHAIGYVSTNGAARDVAMESNGGDDDGSAPRYEAIGALADSSVAVHKSDPALEERVERPSLRRLSGSNIGQLQDDKDKGVFGLDHQGLSNDERAFMLHASKSIDQFESFAQDQGKKSTTTHMTKSVSGLPSSKTGMPMSQSSELEDHEQWLDRAKAEQARKNARAKEKVKERTKDRDSFDYEVQGSNNIAPTTTTHLPKIANPPGKIKKGAQSDM